MGRHSERGQAIVLIAAAMLAMLAIVALAVDGGRIYYDRRALQAAADSAALAAADAYQTAASPDLPTAFAAGRDLFAENAHLVSLAGSVTGSVATYSGGGYDLEIRFVTPAHGSPIFQATAHHWLGMTMMSVLGFGNVQVGADAWTNIKGGGSSGAVLALSDAGCGDNQYAIRLQGGTTVNIDGDVTSDGAIQATSNGGVITVEGAVGYACGDTPAQLPQAVQTAPLADPAYQLPSLSNYTALQPQLGTNVNLQPGRYPSDPGLAGGAGCYFLSTGIYSWLAGYTDNGGLVSNILEPPQPPNRPNQLWATNAPCAGAYYPKAVDVGSNALTAGSWGVVVTALRRDTFWTGSGQVSDTRESAVSGCTPVTLAAGKALQVGISNVPGAQAYSIYLSQNGCAGPFGLAATVPTSGAPQQNNGTCPQDITAAVTTWPAAGDAGASASDKKTCNLGYVITPVLDSTRWTSPTGVSCPLPAAWTTGPLGCAPSSAFGDRANQDYCVDGAGNVASRCPGSASPGAVAYHFPSGSRVNVEGGGATRIFSGMQFANLVIYAVGPSGPSGDSITGGAVTEFIGLSYLPGRDLIISGGTGDLIAGSLVVSTLKFTGGATINIRYDAQYLPPPPGAQLVR